jgi:hypothetical protein
MPITASSQNAGLVVGVNEGIAALARSDRALQQLRHAKIAILGWRPCEGEKSSSFPAAICGTYPVRRNYLPAGLKKIAGKRCPERSAK